MYKLVLFLILVLTFSCKKQSEINIQSGDFIFQDLDCGAMCDAIENATLNEAGIPISHVGIAVLENNQVFIIEAYGSVIKTPLKEFLERTKSVEYVGRLKPKYQIHIPFAIERLKQQIGKDYDEEFKLHNNKFYCSELMYEFFLDTFNKPLFKPKAMTFKNQKTGEFDVVWIEHFKKLNIPIPEGEVGCNPSNYFESDKITILGEM
jgi:hypothetical protein